MALRAGSTDVGVPDRPEIAARASRDDSIAAGAATGASAGGGAAVGGRKLSARRAAHAIGERSPSSSASKRRSGFGFVSAHRSLVGFAERVPDAGGRALLAGGAWLAART